ncbi:MAG: N-acetylmuramidase family protein, partial [Mesorhizobium sp.]
ALQLAAAVNFIAANRLDDKLRKHDWAGFAKGYNGASYRKNAYDTRLADAFRKWSGIKDTPWPPAAPAQPPAPVPIPQAPQPEGPTPSAPKAEPGKAGVRPWAVVVASLVAAILPLFQKVPSLFRKAKP